MVQAHAICDFCSTGFSCARLATALRLLATDPELLSAGGGERAARLGVIKEELASLGWSYPSGGHHCRLSGDSARVRGLTEELIALLAARRQGHPHAIIVNQSLYDEEVHHD